ncbi:unnamed protein product [Sphacelaria rigidula]
MTEDSRRFSVTTDPENLIGRRRSVAMTEEVGGAGARRKSIARTPSSVGHGRRGSYQDPNGRRKSILISRDNGGGGDDGSGRRRSSARRQSNARPLGPEVPGRRGSMFEHMKVYDPSTFGDSVPQTSPRTSASESLTRRKSSTASRVAKRTSRVGPGRRLEDALGDRDSPPGSERLDETTPARFAQ